MAVGFRWCDHRWWHRSILQPAVPSATIQELLTLCKTLSQAHLDTLLLVEAGNYEMAKTKVAILLPHCQASCVLLLAAQADLGAGETDQATVTCNKILEKQRQLTRANMLLGQAAILAGKEKEGMKSIREGLRMDPDSGSLAQAAKGGGKFLTQYKTYEQP